MTFFKKSKNCFKGKELFSRISIKALESQLYDCKRHSQKIKIN